MSTLGWAVDDEVSIDMWHAVLEFAVGDEVPTAEGDEVSTLGWAVDDKVSIDPWHAVLEFAVGDEVSTAEGDEVSTLEFAAGDVVSTADGDVVSTTVAAATGDPPSACVVFLIDLPGRAAVLLAISHRSVPPSFADVPCPLYRSSSGGSRGIFSAANSSSPSLSLMSSESCVRSAVVAVASSRSPSSSLRSPHTCTFPSCILPICIPHTRG